MQMTFSKNILIGQIWFYLTRGLTKVQCPKFIVKIENERLSEKYRLIEQEQKIRFPKFKVYEVKKISQSEDEYFKKLCKGIRLALQ